MRLMRSPSNVEVAITGRCNLRCLYCSHFTSAADVPEDLPASEWIAFFEELGRLAVMSVTLEGGEPFIRPDFHELLEGIVKNRMRFSILSNGTLITEELAALLAATRRCDFVQVSVDGSKPAVHDASRGQGSFFRAVQGLKNLQHYGVPVTVRVTINRNNLHDLPEVARFLLDDLNLSGFSTNSAQFMGLCRTMAERVQLSTAERSQAMQVMWELQEQYPGRISALAGPLAEARDWLKVTQAQREGRKPDNGRGHLVSCGGVFSKLAVRSDGIITPCMQMCHLELGRINRDDLKEIWQHHPDLIRLRERWHIPLSDFLFCRDCKFLPYCSGGCPAVAYNSVGQENHPDPNDCLRLFLKSGGYLPHDRS